MILPHFQGKPERINMSDFEMRNVCKSFPGVKALDNANFHADRGDIVALLGENLARY